MMETYMPRFWHVGLTSFRLLFKHSDSFRRPQMMNGNTSTRDLRSSLVVGKKNYYICVKDWFSLIQY
jgi:hypothetical protein